jgi:hypothetical protein
VTVKGRVLDPDGKPVKSAMLFHPLSLQDHGEFAYFHHYNPQPILVKDGTVTLTGLDPKAKLPLYVLDRKNEVGAAVVLSGKSDGDQVTVNLQPCGKARTRLVDKDGKPVKGMGFGLRIVPDGDEFSALQQADLLGIRAVTADAEGRLTVGGLIPGATYRYHDGQKTQQFTAEAGKTRELPDITYRSALGGGGGSGFSGGASQE